MARETDAGVRDAKGLLEQVAEGALDDDYYAEERSGFHASRVGGVLSAMAVVIFGGLVAVAVVQTRADRSTTALERQTLIEDVGQRRELLEARRTTLETLRSEVEDLQVATSGSGVAGQEVELVAGGAGAEGPGVLLTITGNDQINGGEVRDTDLQILVNGLWYAGAEAVAVNDSRIASTSAIRSASGQMTVNFVSIGPPYEIVALGDGDRVVERFRENPAGRYLDERRSVSGLRYSIEPQDSLEVPPAPAARLTLNHADVREER